jgi:hypothetical protein
MGPGRHDAKMSMSGSRRNIGSDGVSETRWEEGWTEQKKGKL